MASSVVLLLVEVVVGVGGGRERLKSLTMRGISSRGFETPQDEVQLRTLFDHLRSGVNCKDAG